MGIKNLNRFLLDNCSKKTIQKTHLSILSNKKIVIDTSIYLYKFMGENSLMESFYLFISILLKYKISPIFIFDGKPPPEKKELLIQRRIDKLEAREKYYEIKEKMETLTDEKKEEALHEMEHLKKQFIRIKEEDIRKVKDLMDAYGIIWYDAEGESDMLCGYLTKQSDIWGCVSDDMDMFLYGCKRVVRHISLLNHTVTVYDFQKILTDLQMEEKLFREIMVISGTDYNINKETSLYETIKWYYKYKEAGKNANFYEWLFQNSSYVKNQEMLLKVYSMFLLHDDYHFDYTSKNTEKNMEKIKEIMEKEGFIFV